MPSKTTTKRLRSNTQKAGRNTNGRPRRKGKNGGSKMRPDNDEVAGPGLHVLAKDLRSFSRFELGLLTGDQSEGGALNLVDTEAKQLQAIEDLYLIVKAQPRYKKLKEPSWEIDTAPVEILNWLLRKLGPLAKGNRWTVDAYLEGKKQRYQFVVYTHYPTYRIKDRAEYMPLDFLPRLKKRDELLHDIIVDTIALVSRCNKITLWDEDGDYSEALEDLINTGGETIDTEINEQFLLHTEGVAAEYLALIKRRRRRVCSSDITSKMCQLGKLSQRKESLIWWVRSGLQLAAYRTSIEKFSYVPSYMRDKVIGPARLYKFVWSCDEKDYLHFHGNNWMKKQAVVGTFRPVMFTVTKPGNMVLLPTSYEFPVRLYWFMESGVKNVLWRFRDYYYGKRPKGENNPNRTLLDILDPEEELMIDL